MQTLYLEKEPEVTILRDGPAMVVKTEGEAGHLFPLSRVGRVVLHKSAKISSLVLIECSQAGVVFCFTDRKQNPIAWCLQQKDDGTDMGSVWRDFTGRTDWEELFSRWKGQRLENMLTHCAHTLGMALEGQDARQLMRVIGQWGIRFAGETASSLSLKWLETEVLGLLVQYLNQKGMDELQVVPLATALKPVVRWRMESMRIQWLHRRFTQARNRHEKTAAMTRLEFMGFLEQTKEMLNEATGELIELLHSWLQRPE